MIRHEAAHDGSEVRTISQFGMVRLVAVGQERNLLAADREVSRRVQFRQNEVLPMAFWSMTATLPARAAAIASRSSLMRPMALSTAAAPPRWGSAP